MPKVERDEEPRVEPWRLPDLRPSLHYMHDRGKCKLSAPIEIVFPCLVVFLDVGH